MGDKRYYDYSGKKSWTGIGKKVAIDEEWLDAVNKHFANNGYDVLLAVIGNILKDAGHSDLTRAQAWVIAQDVLNGGVPEILRNNDEDESLGKGHLMFDIAQKATQGIVNTTVAAGTMAATAATSTVEMAQNVVTGASSEDSEGNSDSDTDDGSEFTGTNG